jgi:hypothetical protein
MIEKNRKPRILCMKNKIIFLFIADCILILWFYSKKFPKEFGVRIKIDNTKPEPLCCIFRFSLPERKLETPRG